MCGIFGYLHKEKIASISNIDLANILPHRGPDDQGWLIYNGQAILTGKAAIPEVPAKLLLIHKRLSILDPTPAGHQPMTCSNQRFFLIFNGEIYNSNELRIELTKLGMQFFSGTDSEVLLQAYSHWGKACLQKLSGMFAFVIFDKEQKTIFFARDHFGIKPLFYYADQSQFLFASEIKSLLPFLPKKTINPQRLFFYLRSGLTDFADETFFAEIKQLPAGHYFEIALDHFHNIRPVCYWRMCPEINRDISFSEAAGTVRNLFLKSVTRHLRSDVPVAMTLSGGIDSSAIVMAVRHLFPDFDAHTLSYVADDPRLSEEKWIDLINSESSAISHKVFTNPDKMMTDLNRLIIAQDEPFGSTSIYAQYQIFQMARDLKIKVMLDGQGADEMLGGYTFFIAARFATLIKQRSFKQAWQLLFKTKSHPSHMLLLKSLNYLLPARWQMPLRHFTNYSFAPSWLNLDWFKSKLVEVEPLKMRYGKHVLREELAHTFCHSSLPMLLRYQDRNSMAWSVESRVPFLDKELVEFIASLPENYLISEKGHTKAVFREAMIDILPPALLARHDKIGFATPEKNWLLSLQPWFEKILTSQQAKQLPVFHHQKLIDDWQAMLQGKARFDFRFWRWINFIKWSELYQVDFTS
jgi:asparagine synthase (glutamine-hydrolysing)